MALSVPPLSPVVVADAVDVSCADCPVVAVVSVSGCPVRFSGLHATNATNSVSAIALAIRFIIFDTPFTKPACRRSADRGYDARRFEEKRC
jgi:hypothetical protein